MTLVCKSVGIGDGIVNPIYGCGVKMAPDINPIYAGLQRSCPGDSKNVSYVDIEPSFFYLTGLLKAGFWIEVKNKKILSTRNLYSLLFSSESLHIASLINTLNCDMFLDLTHTGYK